MRRLFILRGAPGAGKSSLIKQLNLQPYTIEVDSVRQLLHNPSETIDENGNFTTEINPAYDGKVWDLVFQIAAERMKNGETTFIDATFLFKGAFTKWRKLASKWGYRVTVVTVGKNLLVDEIYYRNLKRPEHKQLHREVIERYYKRLHSGEFDVPNRFNPIEAPVLEDGSIDTSALTDQLIWQSSDVSRYESIQVIGDVHSSPEPLQKIVDEWNDNRLYVFTGDYLDRGTDPVGVWRILTDLLKKDNVVFLVGNHERYLREFAADHNPRNRESLIELLKAGYTPADVAEFLKHTQPLYLPNFNGQQYIITHAGIIDSQTPLVDSVLNNETFYTKGVGGYDLNIDADSWT